VIPWLLDILLGLGLLWLGWRTVTTPTLFRAILLFIVFGLFMALCWARLAAPDVALADAAIGAGITGALLLDAYRALTVHGRRDTWEMARAPAVALALLTTVLVAGLAWALLNLPAPVVDLRAAVDMRLDESGVGNPVTAVLLNFRGYDTLLEIAVLLLALLGVWAVGAWKLPLSGAPTLAADSPLLDALMPSLIPVIVIIGAYLLWAGADFPGGAFQAGSVLAAIGVLLRLSDWLQPAPVPGVPLKAALASGLLVFIGVALGVMVETGALLEYPRPWAGVLILVIETALTLSIAFILVLLFSGSPGLRRGRS
jgi:multisubunit Na+/H+ antiporter MnhB subunit